LFDVFVQLLNKRHMPAVSAIHSDCHVTHDANYGLYAEIKASCFCLNFSISFIQMIKLFGKTRMVVSQWCREAKRRPGQP